MPSGVDHYNSKLTEGGVREIRRRFDAGESRKDLARVFGVTPATIWSVISRQTWKHIEGGDASYRGTPGDGTPRGCAHYNSRMNESAVQVIRDRFAAGESRKTLADAFGVAGSTIWSIVSRQTWKHVD